MRYILSNVFIEGCLSKLETTEAETIVEMVTGDFQQFSKLQTRPEIKDLNVDASNWKINNESNSNNDFIKIIIKQALTKNFKQTCIIHLHELNLRLL